MLLKTSGEFGWKLLRKRNSESDETGCVLRKGSAEGWMVRASCSSTSNLPKILGCAG